MRTETWIGALMLMSSGCGASVTEPSATNLAPTNATDDSPPALFAQLFAPGAQRRYRVETLIEAQDDDRVDPRADENGHIRIATVSEATCTIEPSHVDAGRVVSRIHCDGALANDAVMSVVPSAGNFIEGAWAATSKGLWRITDSDVGATGWTDATALMSARPEAARVEERSDDGISGSVRIVEREGDAWCVKLASWGGDQEADMFCFTPDRGIVSGMRQFSGGTFSEVRFCLEESGCRALPK